MPLKLITSGGGSVILDANTTGSNFTVNVPAQSGAMLTTGSLSGINASAISVGTLPTSRLPTIPRANLPTGSVLQVVTVLKTDQWTSASTSPVDITGMSLSITPTSTSSRILLSVNINVSFSGNGGDGFVRLMRDSTAIGSGNGGFFGQVAGQDYFGVHTRSIQFLDSPATVNATTYKIQGWGNGNTLYVNGRGLNGDFVTSSSLVAMEIAG